MDFEGSKDFYASGLWNVAQKTPLDQPTDWDGLSVNQDRFRRVYRSWARGLSGPLPKRPARANLRGRQAGLPPRGFASGPVNAPYARWAAQLGRPVRGPLRERPRGKPARPGASAADIPPPTSRPTDRGPAS